MVQLPSISDEQRAIVAAVEAGNNVIVDSVAGSGKTTTILHIASLIGGKSFLLFTYNARLKLETRSKAESLKLENLEVHSYHSFVCKYYHTNASTDFHMAAAINDHIIDAPHFDAVIIDEAQDIIPLYHRMIRATFDPMEQYQWIIIGDRRQNIYRFNGADDKYIIRAEDHFSSGIVVQSSSVNPDPLRPSSGTLTWKRLPLSTTYRLTRPIAEFINVCLLHNNRLIAHKTEGTRPLYITDNLFVSCRPNGRVCKRICLLLETYSSEDIFILAPSVRRNSKKNPLSILLNSLSNSGIDIYVPTSDETRVDDDVMRGKLVCLTFHQAKGLERAVVVVFSFDENYFQYYNRTADPNRCPNEIYVAATRAKEQLILLHNQSADYLPFIPKNVGNYVAALGALPPPRSAIKPPIGRLLPKKIDITELTRYIPVDVLIRCEKFFVWKQLVKPGKKINIPTKVNIEDKYEDVSDITGLAIPAIYEFLSRGTSTIAEMMKSTPIKSTKYFLRLCNQYDSQSSGYNHRLRQITTYDWLVPDDVKQCIGRMREHVPIETKYEVMNVVEITTKWGKTLLIGRSDAISNGILWEIKCTAEIQHEHRIQLAAYAYLHPGLCYRILNVLTGEVQEIRGEFAMLQEMINMLIEHKYT